MFMTFEPLVLALAIGIGAAIYVALRQLQGQQEAQQAEPVLIPVKRDDRY
jgi:hypothetical protein